MHKWVVILNSYFFSHCLVSCVMGKSSRQVSFLLDLQKGGPAEGSAGVCSRVETGMHDADDVLVDTDEYVVVSIEHVVVGGCPAAVGVGETGLAQIAVILCLVHRDDRVGQKCHWGILPDSQ